jgi:putative cell wall-binding protein
MQGDAPVRRGARAWRPFVAAAIVATGLVTVVTSSTPGGATEAFTFSRFAGNDRYETSSVIAKAFATNADNAIVATGDTFPDALAGNYLAGSLAAPIVLTKRDELPASSADALSSLKVQSVTLLGGPAAVSDGVKAVLESKGMRVERIAGTTRYDTAQLLAEKPGAAAVGSEGGKKTAILASGENFPDALAAGPVSYAGHFPTLLTTKDSLSPAAKAALTGLGIQQVLIVGGSAAVAPAVESELTGSGIGVVRLAGANRSETASKIADYAINKLGFTNARVTLARGSAFPDALAGGPYGGKNLTVTLLADSPTTLGAATTDWLAANKSTLISGDILGGLNAISRETQTAAEAAAGANVNAPTLTLTEYPTDGSLTGNDKPTYKGVSTDDTGVAKIEVKIDAGSFSTTDITCDACNSPTASWSWTPATALTSATHTFTFRAMDDSGITSTEVTRSLIVDMVKPTLTTVQANGGNTTITAFFSEPLDCSTVAREDFSVKIADSPKNIDVALCSAPSDPTIGLTVQGAPATGQTVKVTLTGEVKDRAGNIADPKEKTGTVSAGTPPTITVDQGPAEGARTFDDTPTYAGLASDSSKVVKIEARIDEENDADGNPKWTNITSSCAGCANGGSAQVSWTFTPSTALPETPHTLEFRATDDSGDVSEIATRTVVIDKTNPTFDSVTATSGTPKAIADFSEALECGTVETDGRDFTVTVNSEAQPRTISAASCSSDKVTITFGGAALVAGDTVNVKVRVANPPDDPGGVVRDVAGNPTAQGLEKTATV